MGDSNSSADRAIVMEPYESPPPFFGGLPSSDAAGTTNLSNFAAYSRLPRGAILPPPKQLSLKTTNQAAKETYLALYEGHFTVHIFPYPFGTGLLFGAPEDAPVPFASAPLMQIIINGILDASSLNTSSVNEDFDSAFSVKDKLRLRKRILHMFLRRHGTKVPPQAVRNSQHVLLEDYRRLKWYNGALDITMVAADITINCDRNNNSAIWKTLMRVGESLEPLGQFVEAGQVYREAAEQGRPLQWKETAMLYNNCGLAFKRANEYEQAEEAYVSALHLESTRSNHWDVNDYDTDFLLGNILMLYYVWFTRPRGQLETSDATKFEMTFSAILYTAGYQASQGGIIGQQSVLQRGPSLQNLLDHSVQSGSGAKQALVRALSVGTAKHFRQEIVSCCIAPEVWVQSNSRSDQQVDEMQNARQDFQERNAHTLRGAYVCCGNVECSVRGAVFGEGALKSCPCKSVYYCSKECQTSHWKVHKATCSWHVEKKKAKSK